MHNHPMQTHFELVVDSTKWLGSSSLTNHISAQENAWYVLQSVQSLETRL